MKKTSMVALTALTISSLCADDMKRSDSMNQKQMPAMADGGLPNPSALPNIDSNNWYVFGEALLWRALQGGTSWAVRPQRSATATGTASVTTNEHFRTVNFEWDWGFRVGIGGNLMNHDAWDMNIYYTWFQTNAEDSVGLKRGQVVPTNSFTSGGGILPIFQNTPAGSGVTGMQSGTIHWQIHYSMIDWEMGRDYYVSKHLALRPYVGVKGGWINQKTHGTWWVINSANKTTYSTKNDFWGVGPSFGVNPKFMLGGVGSHSFSLEGNVGGSLMYGHFDVKSNWSNAISSDTQNLTNMSRDAGAGMLESMLGFSWDTNFNADRCHFTMLLAYELQYWLSQNRFYNAAAIAFQDEDLMLQGGTFMLRFDF